MLNTFTPHFLNAATSLRHRGETVAHAEKQINNNDKNLFHLCSGLCGGVTCTAHSETGFAATADVISSGFAAAGTHLFSFSTEFTEKTEASFVDRTIKWLGQKIMGE